MGVPKFFRYISERYPCLSELVKEYQIPEFDNLYLDMNGIIHMCSHPDDYDPHFRMTEEKMFGDIFHYIEVLFRMIKPQKLFFMAVDGVAPRAKMNQQRGRRFRSAKDAEVLEAKATERGEELPTEARFDSNCITPGTVFMDRLQQQLKFFVQNKISTDRLWQKCKIILSGHETPGEGEHKIMDYIRYMKAQPGYDPNTRHCLYGLDADLIMLGLCSHEPHFSLLREEVRFGKKAKRKNIPEQITFYLLHLSLMREYLELEFLPLKDSLPFQYDMEKIIDDWVLMGFLVGNDFIPNLPNLHIANGALPILYNAYMKILPTLDGYINEGGALNLERFEKFMVALAAIDKDNFSEQYADLKYFHSKTGRRPNGTERKSYKPRNLEAWLPDDEEITNKKPMSSDLAALIKSTDELLLEPNKSGWDGETTATEIFAGTFSETAKVGLLIEPLEDTKSDSSTLRSSDVDSVAKELIGGLLERAVVEVKQEDLPNVHKELIPAESTRELLQNNTEKATEVVLVEPSQSNLDDLALDLIDLEEDGDDGSPFYSDSDSDDAEDLIEAEFMQHKFDYYMNKLDYAKVTPEVMRSQAEGYVRAIQWNLNYYYNGCCSWSWYYPHHYAPYISDIKNFAGLKLEYDMGRPFMPFEQLLAVLPAASKNLLPEAYQDLMVSEDSPIIDYYPVDFKTDLNGKKQEWEAVVLIPFIAENLLLASMAPLNTILTEDEQRRNSHGPMLVYEYTDEDLGLVEAPQYFPAVKHCHARLTPVTIDEIRVPRERLVKGPCPGAITDTYYPGFPTFKHLKYKGHLEKAKVKVFDQPSMNDNMIITIDNPTMENELKEIAENLLNKSVFVSWPHLTEALVVAVSDKNFKIMATSQPGGFSTEPNKGNLNAMWHTMRNACASHYKDRLGIETGDIKVLVHVKCMCGSKYVYSPTGAITVEKQWNPIESLYPLQAIVRSLNVSVSLHLTFSNIQQVFPVGCTVFMLGNPFYGCRGEVIDNTTLKSGRIKCSMYTMAEPDFSVLYKYQQELKYMPAGVACQRLAITPHLLSRITGSIFVTPNHQTDSKGSRVNIGLNLKLNKKNEEIPGYTRKKDGQWLYSPKAIQLVKDYMHAFPDLFRYIQTHLGNDVFTEQDLFPGQDGKGKVKEVADWIKKQAYNNIEHQVVGSQTVDPEIVTRIEEIVDDFIAHNTPEQKILQVKPHLLYKTETQTGFLPPDMTAVFRLYDRVVNVREGFTVPYGCKGTVIGIQQTHGKDRTLVASADINEDDNFELMYDVVFDQEFAGGLQLNCSPNRGYRLPRPALINISHGMRLVQQKTVNPATNTPWYEQKNNQRAPAQQLAMRGSAPSAFANFGGGDNGMRPPHPPMFMQQQYGQQGRQFQPPMQGHRMPGGHMQRPQHRPPQGAGAEFQAFFQDLQRNQAKQTMPPAIFPSHQNMPRPPQFAQAQGFAPQAQSQGFPTQAQPQSQGFPTQAPSQSQSFTPPKPTDQQGQGAKSDETEALKKLLKICEAVGPVGAPAPLAAVSPNPRTNAPPSDIHTSQTQISVQDLFTHARNQEQQKAVSVNRPQSIQGPSPQGSLQGQQLIQAPGTQKQAPGSQLQQKQTYAPQIPSQGPLQGQPLMQAPGPLIQAPGPQIGPQLQQKQSYAPQIANQGHSPQNQNRVMIQNQILGPQMAQNPQMVQSQVIGPQLAQKQGMPLIQIPVQPPVQPKPPVQQSSTYYTLQLLNYCNAQGWGVPRYTYYAQAPGMVRAQVTLPNERSVMGDDMPTKAEAGENAARNMMNFIVQNNHQNGPSVLQNWEFKISYVSPSGFPNPPKQWCQKDATKNQSPIKPNATNIQKNEVNSGNSKFVPLQAVKQQRQRTNSNSAEKGGAARGAQQHAAAANRPPGQNSSPGKSKPGHNTTPSQQHKQTPESGSKPKQRKSRIAANFSAVQPKQ